MHHIDTAWEAFQAIPWTVDSRVGVSGTESRTRNERGLTASEGGAVERRAGRLLALAACPRRALVVEARP